MTKDQLQELAEKIRLNPKQWVLILGDLFSSANSKERKLTILELAAQYQKQFSKDNSFYSHILKRDYLSLSTTLFGDVWNGISFLDDSKEIFLERRKKYAHSFKRKEQINLDNVPLDLGILLNTFSGIILTVCQDEQIEAFWENNHSMPTDENVWTPYTLVTSPKWNRWRKYGEEASFEDVEAYFHDQESTIFKLYGSCQDPYQMLLSRDDFELYYPEDANSMPCTRLLLEKLFLNKNLLFLGADTLFLETCGLPFAPGISHLLEKEPASQFQRYLLLDPGTPEKGWETYHITPIPSYGGDEEALNDFSTQLSQKSNTKKMNSKSESSEQGANKKISNRLLKEKDARQLFWKLYTRRPKSSISENEQYILEEQLLKPEGRRRTRQTWSEKGIHSFSMLANNKADFYDLKKLPGPDKTWDDIRYNEKALQELLWESLDKKSRELLQILFFYGDGFPLGFLQLLSENSDQLRAWKLAGFQLTNSGLYIQRHYRTQLHRRMEYADIIMKTAGSNPNKLKIAHRIDEVAHELDDSYFYPLDKNYFSLSEDTFSQYLMPKEQLHNIFVQMFRKMLSVLADKSEGYNHIRSLLETEIKTIILKLNELEDPDLEWKPYLLYYLLLEIRVLPKDLKELDRQLTDYLLPLDPDFSDRADKKKLQKILHKKMIIYQTKSMIESQDSRKQKQEIALEKCQMAESFFDQAVQETRNSERSLIPKDIFDLGFQLYLFESKIYGRISTLAELERCKREKAQCSEQLIALENMFESLKKAKDLLDKRADITGNPYEDLFAQWHQQLGEYHFKMSQYYWENRQYRKPKDHMIQENETSNYKNALKYYKEALSYYNKFPLQYLQQRADVMRSIADLYCQRGKSEANAQIRNACYDWLENAYALYRSNSDLHGIANVLQSMGNAEYFNHSPQDTRSPMCFYNVSEALYTDLFDRWSLKVVSAFKEGKTKEKTEGKTK